MKEHDVISHEPSFEEKDSNAIENQFQQIRDNLIDIRISQIDLLEDIKYIRSFIEEVNKPKGRAGRKKCRLYFDNRPIDDSELEYLLNSLHMSTTDIAKRCKYFDSEGYVITDKSTIAKYLNNRTRKYRKKGGC